MFLSGYGVFLVFVIFSVLFASAALIVSFIVRPKDSYKNKNSTYECGMEPLDNARVNFDIKYFIFALLFIIFEIEALFLFPWAVVFDKLGLFALIEAFIFVGILILGLIYAWKKDLLEWK